MVHADEISALERRAHAARIVMPEVCKRAGVFKQSWYRARARGRAEVRLIQRLERAIQDIEAERASK